LGLPWHPEVGCPVSGWYQAVMVLEIGRMVSPYLISLARTHAVWPVISEGGERVSLGGADLAVGVRCLLVLWLLSPFGGLAGRPWRMFPTAASWCFPSPLGRNHPFTWNLY